MEKDWIVIYTTSKMHDAILLKEIFEDNEIDSVIINKKDSSYVFIGEIEVYIHICNQEKGLEIIKEFDS